MGQVILYRNLCWRCTTWSTTSGSPPYLLTPQLVHRSVEGPVDVATNVRKGADNFSFFSWISPLSFFYRRISLFVISEMSGICDISSCVLDFYVCRKDIYLLWTAAQK